MIINICEELRKTNVLYVKFLQWNIQDYCNIDDELKQYFYKFSSNVPYSNSDIDYHLINEIHTKFKNRIIFGESPINSGTTALVFKGNMDGKSVAIKILRKNIYEQINLGIDNIQSFLTKAIYFLSFFYKCNINLKSLVNNNKQLLLDQCNLLNEIKNIDLFKKKLFHSHSIVIPHVYKEFTEFSNNIIVMDFLDGENIQDIKTEKMYKYRASVQNFILNSYILFKVIHCDLHIGNIILLDNNQVGIIDFGMIIEISSTQSNNILKFFLSLANSNVKLLIISITNILINNNNDIAKIQCIIKEPLKTIETDLFNTEKKVCINKLIRTIRIILTKINGISEINPKASHILLSIISSIKTLDKFSGGSGLADAIKKHLDTDNFFD
jgi:ubiquinone biosynthesis protein